MKKEIPELKKLELNKQNVMQLLYDCRVTPKSTIVITSNFYHETSSRKAPPMKLDLNQVYSKENLIVYWLGQIKDLHHQAFRLTPAAGILNYNNEKWTDDNRALFALYYLAIASLKLPCFIDGEKGAETPLLLSYYNRFLKPTYSPSDPNFKLEDARKALEDLGVKLPEDITHLD